MKKILITLAIALVSFVASAARYDFTSQDTFGASIEAQVKAENVDEKVFAEKFTKYVEGLIEKNRAVLSTAIPPEKRNTAEAQEIATNAVLAILKKDMADRNLKDILGIKEVKEIKEVK